MATLQAPEGTVNVIIVTNAGEETLDRIRSVAPGRLNVVSLAADLREEIQRDWAEIRPDRRPPTDPPPPHFTTEERETLIREAHAAYFGVPFPLHLIGERATNLQWVHFPFAGVSNIMGTPIWETQAVAVTSSRGYANALPIAELVMAGVGMFAKGLHVAVKNTVAGDFAKSSYPRFQVIAGKTIGIVGLGGIGSHVAHLAKAYGMRVLATRRSAEKREANIQGVDELFPTALQNVMLTECDFVVVCAMWTDETEGMIGADAFAAMKEGAVLINVARGEIVDEPSLIHALRSEKLAGAFLEVYKDDFRSPPNPELAALPTVVITPHMSIWQDVDQNFSLQLFCDNLARFLKGEPLENVVNWARGY
jgi:phosphoglycerate dehydrogenase-like enzyme